MSSNCENSWNRPWSIQELVDGASNWSLAGDAGLLKYLETFSENLLSKAEEANNNLNSLLEDLSSASLSLDVIKNEFSSLHNVQFVESRVYEEDETLPVDQQQESVKDTKITEEERTRDTKEAVLRGIEVIDKYYEKVQVPASDSEDETDFPSFVLRPKDPYIDRPLPYIIGSEDWHKKWHVGLLDSSSDSETDKVSEKFSDSDSESDLPVRNRAQLQFKDVSNSGSEGDLSNRKNINPVANSTFDDSVKQPGIFGSSESGENNSVPAQAPISNRNFAQELAAKLGNVIEQNTQVIEPEVNKRPIQSAAAAPTRIIGNIFSDEPPPIDEDDLMFEKSNIKGVFSGGGDLFDDLDTSGSLWSEKKDQVKPSLEAPKSKLPKLFDDEDDNIFNTGNSQAKNTVAGQNIPGSVTSKKLSEGLFDEDSSEDDLFNERAKKPSFSQPFLHPANKTTMPFIDDEPPEIESKPVASKEDSPKPKKPIGGVKVIEGADLFKHQKIGGLLKIRRQESSESSDKDENVSIIKTADQSHSKIRNKPTDLFSDFGDRSSVAKQTAHNTVKKDDTKENDVSKENVSKKPAETDASAEKNLKQLSLFDDHVEDDSEGLFGDDLFSNISTKKFTSGLFEEKPLSDDLFANVNVEETSKPSSNNLFADVTVNHPSKPPNTDFSAKANVDESMNQPQQIPATKNSSQLFSDDEPFEEQPVGTKDSSKQVQKESGNFKAEKLFSTDSDDDDLFSTNKSRKASQSATVPIAAPRTVKTETSSKTISKTSESNKSQSDQKKSINAENNVQDDLFKTGPGSVSINFFDQNPPDDDDDWDTKSENNLFEENDPTLFDNTPEINSHRSGLFDNEPPSLFYESSGIVRDISNRGETDDSFNPYASSSRRFSSDIFNEQQSSDSFFVTKNKSHIESQPALGSIQEISNPSNKEYSYSNVDITPSGNIDDLFPDSVVSVTGTSLSTQNDFAEDLPSDEAISKSNDKVFKEQSSAESDLFAPSGKATRPDILKEFEKDTGKLESKTLDKTNAKPPITAKPSSSVKKEERIGDTIVSPQGSTTPKIVSPGKLKHNLNINVNALLPGVSPPKRKHMEKSSSFEATSSCETNTTEASSKSLSPTSTASKSSEELPQDESRKSVDMPVNFESTSSLPEVLPSITKDRVRIPIKRRPSTRKARQESIRNSGIDFKINIESEQGTKSEEDTKAAKPVEASLPSENIFRESEAPLPTENIFKEPEAVLPTENIFRESEAPLPTENIFKEPEASLPTENIFREPEASLHTENIFREPEAPLHIENIFGEPEAPLHTENIFGELESPLHTENIFGEPEASLHTENIFGDPEAPLHTENIFGDPEAPLHTENIFGELEAHLPTDNIIEEPKAGSKKGVTFKSKEQINKPDVSLFDDSIESDSIESDSLFGGNVSSEINIQSEKKASGGSAQSSNDRVTDEHLKKPSIYAEEKRSVINSDSFESADFKKSDLFDDSEEFDDIFSSKKLPPKSNILKKSLFDDELDDDDIFGSSSNNERSTLVKGKSESKAPQKKSAKVTQVKKLENTAAVEDPLSAFND